MGMRSFTFVAPGAMSPVPKLGSGETTVVQQGGGGGGGGTVGTLTLQSGSNSNVQFGGSGAGVTVASDHKSVAIDLSQGNATVTIDVYYK